MLLPPAQTVYHRRPEASGGVVELMSGDLKCSYSRDDNGLVPTHREYPWERDRRAIEDRERGRARASLKRDGSRSHSPRVQLSVGGQRKTTHRGRHGPRLVMTSGERRIAGRLARLCLFMLIVYATLHHSILLMW